MPISIDAISPEKSLIDLSALPKNTFGSVFVGYNLKSLLDDVLLAEYIDETSDGRTIQRNGIFVPVNADTRAWRIGKVVLSGAASKYVKAGDIILFPNNVGIPISNIDIEGHGSLGHGIFINEQRIFGVCTQNKENESVASHIKKTSSKQRS